MTEIKLCPFCNGVPSKLYTDISGFKKCAVFCMACESRTDYFHSDVGAELAWNKRTDNTNQG